MHSIEKNRLLEEDVDSSKERTGAQCRIDKANDLELHETVKELGNKTALPKEKPRNEVEFYKAKYQELKQETRFHEHQITKLEEKIRRQAEIHDTENCTRDKTITNVRKDNNMLREKIQISVLNFEKIDDANFRKISNGIFHSLASWCFKETMDCERRSEIQSSLCREICACILSPIFLGLPSEILDYFTYLQHGVLTSGKSIQT
jgi:hypothetical protein